MASMEASLLGLFRYIQRLNQYEDEPNDMLSEDSKSNGDDGVAAMEMDNGLVNDIHVATGGQECSQMNAVKLLRNRECEVKGRFRRGRQAGLMSRFIPNTCQGIVDRYQAQAFCGQFSQDGSIFMAAVQDAVVRLYHHDSGTFTKFATLDAQDIGWSIIDTAFSPDKNYVIYSSWSDHVFLCHTDGQKEQTALNLRPERGSHFCAFSVTFSPNSQEILAGCSDHCLYMYDLEKGRRTMRIEAHDDDVNTVCFANDESDVFFSGSDDSLIKVWDRRTLDSHGSRGVPAGVLVGHVEGLTHVASKGDGRYLVSNGKDQCAKLWDIRRMCEQKKLPPMPRRRNWDYRGFGGDHNRTVAFREHQHDQSIMTYRGHDVLRTLIRCYFSPAATTGQKYIYTGSADGGVYIYDVLTGALVQKLGPRGRGGHTTIVRDVSWHPTEPIIASTSWDGTVRSWTFMDDSVEAMPSPSAAVQQFSEEDYSGEGDDANSERE